MTQEEKDLLLKDLCARLPYGVIVAYKNQENKEGRVELDYGNIGYVAELGRGWWIVCKPYLRPMSSMTEEEKMVQRSKMRYEGYFVNHVYYHTLEEFDYLNSIHVDYRELIEKGLALEAPEGMYNIKMYNIKEK